jgi:hypothetical protein
MPGAAPEQPRLLIDQVQDRADDRSDEQIMLRHPIDMALRQCLLDMTENACSARLRWSTRVGNREAFLCAFAQPN